MATATKSGGSLPEESSPIEYAISSTAEPITITEGLDDAMWFTDYASDTIGRITTTGVVTEYSAPACGLGFSASFAGSTLTLNYDLAIDKPATFEVLLIGVSGPIGSPVSKPAKAVVPPQVFTEKWPNIPDLGTITVQSSLTAGPGQVIRSQWTTVNTAQ